MSDRSFFGIALAWRRLLLQLTIIGALGAIVVSLLLPAWYSATAMITPPQEREGGFGLMALMDQIGSSVGVGRARSLLKRTPQVDLMIGVLKSRRIRGEVVDRFSLQETYSAKTRDHAIKELGGYLSVNTSPEGFVEVRVEARDPQLAADMANAFVEFLDNYNRTQSVEDARRTSAFIEQCRTENRARLEVAAAELRVFQERFGAIQIDEQIRVTVDALAQLEAERTQLGIEKGVLENFSRPDRPQVVEVELRIAEVEKHLDRLSGSAPGDSSAMDAADRGVLIPLADFPRLGLAYANLKREVLVQEKVYEFLTSQFEESRIREARDLRTLTVLDAAVPPIRKARPRRSLIVILTTGLSFVLALGLAFAVEGLRDAMSGHPEWGSAREMQWLLRTAEALRRSGGPASG